MDKTFKELVDMYNGIVKRFNKIELREWHAEGCMIELMKQVGEIVQMGYDKRKVLCLDR